MLLQLLPILFCFRGSVSLSVNISPSNDIAIEVGEYATFICNVSNFNRPEDVKLRWKLDRVKFSNRSEYVSTIIYGKSIISNFTIHAVPPNIGHSLPVLCTAKERGERATGGSTLHAIHYPCSMNVECLNKFLGIESVLHCRWKPNHENCTCYDCEYQAAVYIETSGEMVRYPCLNPEDNYDGLTTKEWCNVELEKSYRNPEINFTMNVLNALGNFTEDIVVKPKVIYGESGSFHSVTNTTSSFYQKTALDIVVSQPPNSFLCWYRPMIQYKVIRERMNLDVPSIKQEKYIENFWNSWQTFTLDANELIDDLWLNSISVNGYESKNTCGNSYKLKLENLPGNSFILMRSKLVAMSCVYGTFACADELFYSLPQIILTKMLPVSSETSMTILKLPERNITNYIECNEKANSDSIILWEGDDMTNEHGVVQWNISIGEVGNSGDATKLVSRAIKQNTVKKCLPFSSSKANPIEFNLTTFNDVSFAMKSEVFEFDQDCSLILVAASLVDVSTDGFARLNVQWNISNTIEFDRAVNGGKLDLIIEKLTTDPSYFDDRCGQTQTINYTTHRTTILFNIRLRENPMNVKPFTRFSFLQNSTEDVNLEKGSVYRIAISPCIVNKGTSIYYSGIVMNQLIHIQNGAALEPPQGVSISHSNNELVVKWKNTFLTSPCQRYTVYYTTVKPCVDLNQPYESCHVQTIENAESCESFSSSLNSFNVTASSFTNISKHENISIVNIEPRIMENTTISIGNVASDVHYYIWMSSRNANGESYCSKVSSITVAVKHKPNYFILAFLLVAMILFSLIAFALMRVKIKKALRKMFVPKPVILTRMKLEEIRERGQPHIPAENIDELVVDEEDICLTKDPSVVRCNRLNDSKNEDTFQRYSNFTYLARPELKVSLLSTPEFKSGCLMTNYVINDIRNDTDDDYVAYIPA